MIKKFVVRALAAVGVLAIVFVIVGMIGAHSVATAPGDPAASSKAEYEIVRQHGSPMDMCVHAGYVASDYLAAHDADAYAKWNMIKIETCRKVGVTD